jgi:nucleoside-diphosphate-sugar epimerase
VEADVSGVNVFIRCKYLQFEDNLFEKYFIQALKANHKVVVLARDPSKLLIPEGSGGVLGNTPFSDSRLKVIKGDVTDQATVNSLFDSVDDLSGVIVALGGRTKNVGPTMLTDGTKNIVNAMKRKSGIKRIAITTSIGAGDSEKQAPFKFRMLMYTVMRSIFRDKNNQEGIFLNADGPGHDLE